MVSSGAHEPEVLDEIDELVAVGVARWPAVVALLTIGIGYLLVSDRLTLGPSWLLLALLVPCFVLFYFAHRREEHLLIRKVALALVVGVTILVGSSVFFLVTQLVANRTPALSLLRDAAIIWVVNVMTFALWYWEIDGGGPHRRHPGRHASTDFAFPQQQQEDDGIVEGWSPGFIDYLFLAFNTSTAFSPTDTLVLSRRAKILMMGQSSLSLVVLAVLAARAINTL